MATSCILIVVLSCQITFSTTQPKLVQCIMYTLFTCPTPAFFFWTGSFQNEFFFNSLFLKPFLQIRKVFFLKETVQKNKPEMRHENRVIITLFFFQNELFFYHGLFQTSFENKIISFILKKTGSKKEPWSSTCKQGNNKPVDIQNSDFFTSRFKRFCFADSRKNDHFQLQYK